MADFFSIGGARKFELDLDQALDDLNENEGPDFIRAIASDLLHDIVPAKPDPKTGRTRGAWDARIGAPVEGETGRLDKGGSRTIAAAMSKLDARFELGTPVYLGNESPLAPWLDEAQFGLPVTTAIAKANAKFS